MTETIYDTTSYPNVCTYVHHFRKCFIVDTLLLLLTRNITFTRV